VQLDASRTGLIISRMENTLDREVEQEATAEAEVESCSGFVLTEGDIEIFRLVLQHRFLRREQLSILTRRPPKRLHRRLLILVKRGFLTTLRFPLQKHIYGIGRAAMPVLAEQGMTNEDLLDQRLRTSELSELFLKHEMMIVDIHVILTTASYQGAVRLVDWREGRELYDFVVAADHKGSGRLPVRPDAFFTIEDSRRPEGANRAHFALEADRSTANQTRFEEKIRAYWHYIQQGLHAKKYGVKGFRVLTITITDKRAKSLCALAAAVLPESARKYFLFAPLYDVSVDDPMSASTCYSPRTADSDQRHPLVPAPNQLQKESAVV
jgi:hypothetical protein